jgi:hypothetical protein
MSLVKAVTTTEELLAEMLGIASTQEFALVHLLALKGTKLAATQDPTWAPESGPAMAALSTQQVLLLARSKATPSELEDV